VSLPVTAVLPRLVAALRRAGAAVLVAPPGTGKTTVVPVELAAHVAGRVVVAEPRRVAARAAARRMAAQLGTPVGAEIGYTVRGDRRVGAATRVEVVTTGVLVQRLQRDPELAGVDAVVLDECHERHLDTDLALAFLVDVRATLRPNLLLLATSATADASRLAELLDGPVVEVAGVLHPVDAVHTPPARPVAPAHGLRVDPRLLDHVAATTRRALGETSGDVLVFLPGTGEIRGVTNRLGGAGVDVVPLHGRLPAAAQDAALRHGDRRRVVLATSVAETSLTVPGVRVVVDAGLARVPRTDQARGLGSLATVRVSRSAADQRAGRAGREAPGRVYRCWSPAEHDRLPRHPEPEIAVADLAGFALALACWGHPDGTGLALPDQPPGAAMEVARTTLRALGAVDDTGRATARGRRLAAVGAHPRLARALLDGAALVGVRRAAEVVALLADDASTDDDLGGAWRRVRAAGASPWRDEVRRLSAAVSDSAGAGPGAGGSDGGAGGAERDAVAVGGGLTDDLAAGLLVGLAYPERLARARRPGGSTYLMAGGTAAELPAGSRLAGSAWLAIAVADRPAGAASARIRLAAAVDSDTAREAGATLLISDAEVAWVDGDVVARRIDRLGAIVLAERELADPDQALVAAAVREGLRREGLALLTWTREAVALRQRLAFCHAVLGEPWPDVADDALLAAADRWLPHRVRRRADLRRIDVVGVLRGLLPWREAARLDQVAPERLPVPSGSQVRVDYADPQAPTLSVKVQEAFGWQEAPTVGDGRAAVLLHLLSPAGRPVAVTRDLASFWRTGYPQVRAELRGRYPRHPWPDDPLNAPPTRRVNPRK
jgi:ATP-dependent helicase HrpB